MSAPDPGSTATTEAPAPAVDISAETPLGLVDMAVVGLVVAFAVWYLYRKLWARRGSCDGCAKGSGNACGARRLSQACEDGKPDAVEIPVDRIQRPR